MNASRVSPAALLAVLLSVTPAQAQAQTPTPVEAAPADDWSARALNRPTQLQPPGEGDPAARGETPPPFTTITRVPAPPAAAGTEPRVPEGFQVDQLDAVNPDSAGVLGPAQGGFAPTLWDGTKRPLVDALLPNLPVATTSPAQRAMIRRLLLSTARAPEGQALPGSLMALRIRLLAEMGDAEGVQALLTALPRENRSEPLLRIENESLLLAGETAKACAHAATQLQHGNLPYWQKVLIFCQTLAGEREKAALGADLLREGGQEDPGFFLLLDAFGGKAPGAFPAIPNPTALHVAMARAAKVEIPEAVLRTASPAILRTVAMDADQPLELRVLAAERAEAAGALPAATLRQSIEALPLTEAELANPLSTAEALFKEAEAEAKAAAEPPARSKGAKKAAPREKTLDPALKARALLFRAALTQKVPAARAEALAAALAQADKDGRFVTAARLLRPALEELDPASEHVKVAPLAVRALLILDQRERAAAWYRQMKGGSASAKVAARLKPLLRLAGMAEASDWSPHDLNAWWDTARNEGDPRDRAALLFGLLEGFDNFVPDAFWDRIAAGPATVQVSMPHAALWQKMAAASKFGRLGETVLLALTAIGEGGPSEAHPIVMRQVLAALRAVHLDADARTLAVEAMAAGGK
jgi:hypothetical protein